MIRPSRCEGMEKACMRIKLRFLGAARSVTGSKYLVEVDGLRLLVDCGLYQERDLRGRNWEKFPVAPDSIDAVLLTHAHLDHCGLLPKLVREGFRGKIYCTAATAEIARIILLDAAHLQEEDAEFKRRRHEREGRKGPYPEVPLYRTQDAQRTFPHFRPVEYRQPVRLGKLARATFFDAGHVFGSAMIKLDITRKGKETSILFSGDVGRKGKPILPDPTTFDRADYVLVESTYGNRLHEPFPRIEQNLAEVINTTKQAGGNVIIPSFALERSQEVLYHLNELLLDDRIPHLLVFLDSPMAIRITEVFREHPELFDAEMLERLRRHSSPFDFPGLKMTETTDESKSINHIRGTVIVIAGSGMCTGGRVKHHLVNNITREESTILFVGYQAVGTLGRIIVDGAEEVRILGQMYPVRARIVQIHGLSAHADRDELFNWLTSLKEPPKGIFVVHGETDSAEEFRDFVADKTGWNVSVPDYEDQVVLD